MNCHRNGHSHRKRELNLRFLALHLELTIFAWTYDKACDFRGSPWHDKKYLRSVSVPMVVISVVLGSQFYCPDMSKMTGRYANHYCHPSKAQAMLVQCSLPQIHFFQFEDHFIFTWRLLIPMLNDWVCVFFSPWIHLEESQNLRTSYQAALLLSMGQSPEDSCAHRPAPGI